MPDDRLVASTLLLQSAHPGSAVFVARAEPIDRKASLTAPKPALATAMSLSDAAAFSPSRDANLALAHNVCGASVTIAWCEREIAAAGDRMGGLLGEDDPERRPRRAQAVGHGAGSRISHPCRTLSERDRRAPGRYRREPGSFLDGTRAPAKVRAHRRSTGYASPER